MEDKKEYPRKANKTERATITKTFGERWIPIIESLLDDMYDIYPYMQFHRDVTGFKHLMISASRRNTNKMYTIGQDGNIYLKGIFSLFPLGEYDFFIIKK